jgi:hypothetical protein
MKKGEVTGYMNEREVPHLVELELLPGGSSSLMPSTVSTGGIPIRWGGGHEVEQVHVAFASPMPPLLMFFGSASARAFLETIITRAPDYVLVRSHAHQPASVDRNDVRLIQM